MSEAQQGSGRHEWRQQEGGATLCQKFWSHLHVAPITLTVKRTLSIASTTDLRLAASVVAAIARPRMLKRSI